MGFNETIGRFDDQPFRVPEEFVPNRIRDMPTPGIAYILNDERFMDEHNVASVYAYSRAHSYTEVINNAMTASWIGTKLADYYRIFRIPEGFVLDLSFLELDVIQEAHSAGFDQSHLRGDIPASHFIDVTHVLFNPYELQVAQVALEAYGIDIESTSVNLVMQDAIRAYDIEEEKQE